MKYLGVLCVSVFSAFKVIVTRGASRTQRSQRRRARRDPSSLILHPSSLLYRIYSTRKGERNNMHPRSEEVVNYLDKTRTELRAAVESVPAHARNQKPAADQWSVAQVLDHLAIVHGLVATSVGKWIDEAKSAGLGPETSYGSLLNTIPSER